MITVEQFTYITALIARLDKNDGSTSKLLEQFSEHSGLLFTIKDGVLIVSSHELHYNKTTVMKEECRILLDAAPVSQEPEKMLA